MLFAAREGEPRAFEAPGIDSLSARGLDRARRRRACLRAIGVAVAPEVAERLVTAAGGNPLALRELPRCCPLRAARRVCATRRSAPGQTRASSGRTRGASSRCPESARKCVADRGRVEHERKRRPSSPRSPSSSSTPRRSKLAEDARLIRVGRGRRRVQPLARPLGRLPRGASVRASGRPPRAGRHPHRRRRPRGARVAPRRRGDRARRGRRLCARPRLPPAPRSAPASRPPPRRSSARPGSTPPGEARRLRLAAGADAAWHAGRRETALALSREALDGCDDPVLRSRMLHLQGPHLPARRLGAERVRDPRRGGRADRADRPAGGCRSSSPTRSRHSRSRLLRRRRSPRASAHGQTSPRTQASPTSVAAFALGLGADDRRGRSRCVSLTSNGVLVLVEDERRAARQPGVADQGGRGREAGSSGLPEGIALAHRAVSLARDQGAVGLLPVSAPGGHPAAGCARAAGARPTPRRPRRSTLPGPATRRRRSTTLPRHWPRSTPTVATRRPCRAPRGGGRRDRRRPRCLRALGSSRTLAAPRSCRSDGSRRRCRSSSASRAPCGTAVTTTATSRWRARVGRGVRAARLGSPTQRRRSSATSTTAPLASPVVSPPYRGALPRDPRGRRRVRVAFHRGARAATRGVSRRVRPRPHPTAFGERLRRARDASARAGPATCRFTRRLRGPGG